MSVDKTAILTQKRKLNDYADELAAVHTKLVRYQESLNTAWAAPEMDMMNDAIERVNRRISRVKEELDSIGADMARAADDIAAEEEEEERKAEEQAQKENSEENRVR